jgi:hypothetical protein
MMEFGRNKKHGNNICRSPGILLGFVGFGAFPRTIGLRRLHQRRQSSLAINLWQRRMHSMKALVYQGTGEKALPGRLGRKV